MADQQVPPVVLEVDQVDPPAFRGPPPDNRNGISMWLTGPVYIDPATRSSKPTRSSAWYPPVHRTGGPDGRRSGWAPERHPARLEPDQDHAPAVAAEFLARCGHPLVRREAVPAVRGEHIAPGTAEVGRGVTAARRVDKPVYEPCKVHRLTPRPIRHPARRHRAGRSPHPRLVPSRSWPPRSANLTDVEADNDTAVNGICALVGINVAVGLLRGEPRGDRFT